LKSDAQVADDWADLTDGTLDNLIVIDENGMNKGNGEVWTGAALYCFEP